MLIILLFIIFPLTLSDKWYSTSQCTQKEYANHMDINCNSDEIILIGWSHYGTKKISQQNNKSCQPSENDCIMDYTHKIAELCNGISACEVILTQQFIHKCSDEATYLFISYQCIQNSTMVDVCSKRSITSMNSLNLISPMFPNEYSNNLNCSCRIESNENLSNMIIDVENLSFNLQDNDKLLNFSGTIPFGISLLKSEIPLNLIFQTDETLSQSGFWIRLSGYQQCHSDEYNLGSKCLKIFLNKQTWQSAESTCSLINSKLVYLDDIIEEKKLSDFILKNFKQITSFWILNKKERFDNNNISWWPWRSSNQTDECVLHSTDGWMKRSCDEQHSFICQRNTNQQSISLTLSCGNIQPEIILTTTTAMTTESTTTQMIKQLLSSTAIQNLKKTKTSTIDTNILLAILGGIFLVILSINIVVCYLYKRNIKTSSKCPKQNISNTSYTHEELQRSLMQHLYHEQTNTISSTSSSKDSQTKSNDTTGTASSNLFQLCSPPTTNILLSKPLYFPTDQVDYHIYETIPSENCAYAHSAFKPVIQSHTHTIRPYCPRTNILYHHSTDSLKQSYDTLSKIPPNATVLMPVCCHHYTSGTLTKHFVPSSTTQIYTRTESIV